MNRRTFLSGLCAGTALAGTVSLASKAAAKLPALDRDISLVNLHTGEKFRGQFRTETGYLDDSLGELSKVLRDHRSGDTHDIDPQLFDWMASLSGRLGGGEFSIISGYRSPKTNAALRSKSNGVAKRSWHMQGRAIDLRLDSASTEALRRIAINDSIGGVGYYPKSNFLHLDTGNARLW